MIKWSTSSFTSYLLLVLLLFVVVVALLLIISVTFFMRNRHSISIGISISVGYYISNIFTFWKVFLLLMPDNEPSKVKYYCGLERREEDPKFARGSTLYFCSELDGGISDMKTNIKLPLNKYKI